MASFALAFAALKATEGGWSDDERDRGGETYAGISRRHYPRWSGWKRIDAAKRSKGFPANLAADRYLPRMIARFYKRHYWDRFLGDDLPLDELGAELLDASVNVGLKRAVRFMQESLNLLNRNQQDYPDIVVDGLLGERTLEVMRRHLAVNRTPRYLLKVANIVQGGFYLDIMRQNPRQERFARGWLDRA
jgi:lysozyme family protein